MKHDLGKVHTQGHRVVGEEHGRGAAWRAGVAASPSWGKCTRKAHRVVKGEHGRGVAGGCSKPKLGKVHTEGPPAHGGSRVSMDAGAPQHT